MSPDDDEDAPLDREEYINPPERDGSEPPVRMKCRGCEHRWLKPANEQARRCPACGGHCLVQLPSRRGELFIGLLAGLGYVGVLALAVIFTQWKGNAAVSLPTALPAATAPSPAEVTHDLATLTLEEAVALEGSRHRFRFVRDSNPEEAGGRVSFDCAGPEDGHRSVSFRTGGATDGEKTEGVVEARICVIVHGGWGPFAEFYELRLVDAR